VQGAPDRVGDEPGEALVAKVRGASEARRIVAHTPLERPERGRPVEQAGFVMVRETDDVDEGD
jgi:hypothetical protein